MMDGKARAEKVEVDTDGRTHKEESEDSTRDVSWQGFEDWVRGLAAFDTTGAGDA